MKIDELRKSMGEGDRWAAEINERQEGQQDERDRK